MSYEKLDRLNKTLDALSHAMAMLNADEAINMPRGGGAGRAEALSTLSAMHHEKASAPEIAEWIERAELEDLSPDQAAGVAEFKRLYRQRTCLSAEFVGRKTRASIQAEQLWRELRPAGDWAGFLPALSEVVSLAREEAEIRAQATGLSPYDALMEQFDPGNRTADINPVFANLKDFLKDFVPEALRLQEERHKERPLKPLDGPFAIEKQKQLGLLAMKQIGFDFDHGRLDTSHHPFCGGVPTDVRLTTRYVEEDFLPGLMGTLHETGHAQYEQGLPRKDAHWPHNKARGMGVHESQSLFVEMQIVRSQEFWQWALPVAGKTLGKHVFENWDIEDVLAHVNLVEPGFIRVDADEVTYPLHVILRYELEQDLISGAMEVPDIPEAWDQKMSAFLGLSTKDNMKDGPMQDVHWPAGYFGYFPSYTLGAMMAAQQWAAMKRDIPDISEQIARGEFARINAWRNDKIWKQGARLSTPELMKQATGQPLDASYFINHLKKRYGS